MSKRDPFDALGQLWLWTDLSSGWCRDPEGWGPFSKLREPDFTMCFEDVTIMLIPFLLIVLLAPARMWRLSKRSLLPRYMTHNAHYFVKLTLLLLLFLTNISRLVLSFRGLRDVQFLSQAANLVGMVLVIGLHHLEYTRNRIASGILLFYWLFVIGTNSIKLYSVMGMKQSGPWPGHPYLATMFFTSYMLSFVMLFLEGMKRPQNQPIFLQDKQNACPETEANIFGRLIFSWMTPLMKLGYRKPLSMDDLWNLEPENQSAEISTAFEHHWKKEMRKDRPSLLRALIRTHGGPFACAAVLKAAQDVLQFSQPLLLRELMGWVASYTTDHPEPPYKGYLIASGMFIMAVTQTLFLHQYFQLCFVTGMRVRASLVTAIYKKALVLSNTSRQVSTVGEIVNHMSVDAQRLMDLCTYLHIVWSGPFQIGIALVLLWHTVGASIWAGVGVLVLVIPINTLLARRMRTFQKQQMTNKDTRVKLMSEILGGILAIKLYAWEQPFVKKVAKIRNDMELAMLKRIGVLSAGQSFTWSSIPFFVSLSTFAVYVLTSPVPLTSQTAFVALSLFSLLQFPLTVFPNAITSVIEAGVSLARIEKYLKLQELDPEAVQRENYRSLPNWKPTIPLVEMQNATLGWAEEPVLENVDLQVHKGELIGVIGRVGTGKSTLLNGMLGNAVKFSGHVAMRGSIAYVPQEPWMMNASLRENIVFGLSWDPIFYEKVIDACALGPDLDVLPAGDETEIGERGINLSGGQKARVSLARALYSRADIFLLDDPLSAVDAHVGQHLFRQVIGPQGLLRNKTRVLVTHALAYLHLVDRVVMLKGRHIILNGSFTDLMSQRSELYTLMTDHRQQPQQEQQQQLQQQQQLSNSVTSHIEPEDIAEDATYLGQCEEEASINCNESRLQREQSSSDASSIASSQRTKRDSISIQDHQEAVKGRLMTVEESAVGKVPWAVYKQYAHACSVAGVVMVLVFQVCAQSAQVGANFWLKHWSANNERTNTNEHVWMYLGIYGLIGWSSTIFSLLQTLTLWVLCAIRSSKMLHMRMLNSVIRSPMAFFDTTPLGRILNRFSKDQHTVDELLPRMFNLYLRVLASVIATVAIIAFSTPFFVLLVIPLGFVYIGIQRYYLSASRELKRLDSVGKSPIYSFFEQSLAGVATIRAYDQQKRFVTHNQDLLDYNQRAYFPLLSCNRWLAVRLEFLGSIIILGAALFAVLGVLHSAVASVDAGLVGLSVSYALGVTQSLNWVIRSYCDLETNIVSVERILQYIQLPSEKYESPRKASPNWPSPGKIEFQDYGARYRPGMPLAVSNVSLTIEPRQKIGIVGRTGSGKTTLSLGLFRIMESAAGAIMIDNVDIATLPLVDLRSRLTIIPQDTVLFAGTVRENLDPFNEYDDVAIWEALTQAHLDEYVAQLDEQLLAEVSEGGDNFSVGQRQLICLARALLRRTSILVLDEATAAIDVETDTIVQEAIRHQFHHCTVITIAHRINTVMDSDRVLVLGHGKVQEYGSPRALLKNKSSEFYSLSKEAGLVE